MKKLLLLFVLISFSLQAQVLRKGTQVVGGANSDSQVITISGNDLTITNGAAIKVNPQKFVPTTLAEIITPGIDGTNKTWEIRAPHDLGGQTITLPAGVTLSFIGPGVLSNGVLVGNNTKINAETKQIFETNVQLNGSWSWPAFYPEWYGAIPNDAINDFDAFEASIVNACEINLQEGTYILDGSVDISKTQEVLIHGGGATLQLNNSSLDGAFDFQSNIPFVKMTDLKVSGNNVSATGFRVRTSFVFENVDFNDFVNATTSVAGVRVEIDKKFDRAKFINCNGDNFDGGEDTIIGNGVGAARAIVVNFTYVSEITRVEVIGGNWTNAWGDDGDIFQIAGTSNTYDHGCKFIIRDAYVANASRRLIKGTTSGFEAYNTYFQSADPSNPKVAGNISAGMLTFSIFNDGLTPNERNLGGRFVGCTFDNETGGYDGRIIATKASNIEINDCTFKNAFFITNVAVGDIEITGNTFEGGDIHSTGACQFEGEIIVKGNNYKHVTGQPYRALVELNDAGGSFDNLEIINNTITTDENAGDTFFGVIYATTGSTYGKIEIIGNTVLRSGTTPRNELLRIDGDLTDEFVVFNNTLRSPSYVEANALDFNGTNATEPIVKDNKHSTGVLMGEVEVAAPVESLIYLLSDASTTDEGIVTAWSTNPDTSISSDTDSFAGANAVLLEKTAGTVEFNTFSFPAISGKQYKVQYTAKVNVQNAQRALSWQGISETINQSFQLTYTSYEEVVTATANTIDLRFYVSASGAGANGDQLFIDNLKVFEIN